MRLDWQESGLKATVRGRPAGAPVAESEAARMAVATARRDKQMPAALASMIHEQESVESRGLSEKAWAEIRCRAESVGIAIVLSSDGWVLEASVSRAALDAAFDSQVASGLAGAGAFAQHDYWREKWDSRPVFRTLRPGITSRRPVNCGGLI